MKKSDLKNKKILPDISVVIPVKNAENTIRTCIESILTQIVPPSEIIIVLNNSDGETKNIISDIALSVEKIKVISEKRKGRGAARNAGIIASSGEIIAMTDADCVVPKNWLSSITQPIIEEGENIVMGFEEDAVKNYWSKRMQEEDTRFIGTKKDGGYINHLDTKNFAIRRELVRSFMFNPNLEAYEDWDFFLRIKRAELKIRFLPEIRVLHKHSSSASGVWCTQFYRAKSMERIFKSYREDAFFKKYFLGDESAISRRWRNFLFFPPWVFLQFVKDPKRAPYRILADISWKAGILSEKISFLFTSSCAFFFRKKFGIQMETPEISTILRSITPPLNLLVFGVGNDSPLWHCINKGGKTVFIEDRMDWFIKKKKEYPFLEAYIVEYKTKISEWRELLGNPKKLRLDFPKSVSETKWDMVLVDGPEGWAENTPGRMKSIYWSSRLVKKGGIVFVHDSEREVERAYGEKYLWREGIIAEVKGRSLLREYVAGKN